MTACGGARPATILVAGCDMEGREWVRERKSYRESEVDRRKSENERQRIGRE